jgi:hypothetical protein
MKGDEALVDALLGMLAFKVREGCKCSRAWGCLARSSAATPPKAAHAHAHARARWRTQPNNAMPRSRRPPAAASAASCPATWPRRARWASSPSRRAATPTRRRASGGSWGASSSATAATTAVRRSFEAAERRAHGGVGVWPGHRSCKLHDRRVSRTSRSLDGINKPLFPAQARASAPGSATTCRPTSWCTPPAPRAPRRGSPACPSSGRRGCGRGATFLGAGGRLLPFALGLGPLRLARSQHHTTRSSSAAQPFTLLRCGPCSAAARPPPGSASSRSASGAASGRPWRCGTTCASSCCTCTCRGGRASC